MKFKVMYGSIYNENNTDMISNLVMVVDKQCGTLLKYGDAEMSNIKDWYVRTVEKFRDIDEETADNIVMIEFSRYNGVLSIEDICTILNYAVNCSGTSGFIRMLDMDKDSLKSRIEQLRKYGY